MCIITGAPSYADEIITQRLLEAGKKFYRWQGQDSLPINTPLWRPGWCPHQPEFVLTNKPSENR